MPSGPAWTSPAPYLVSAAVAVAAGQHDSCAAALNAAEPLLAGLPAAQQVAGRLAAEVIRLTSCLRTGDLTAAATAADRAELMLRQAADGKLARHPEITQHVLSGRAAVELWSGARRRQSASWRPGWPPRPRPAGSTSKPIGPGR
jgi:hypothetical protein